MDAHEWIALFAAEVGVEPPTDDEIEKLLDLAGVAAHASERIAAPLTCWLAARADLAPADALALAHRMGDRAQGD
jgi:hypothetical protein